MTRRHRFATVTTALTLALWGGGAATAAAETIAIENARVHLAPGDVLEEGTVIIRDGVIAAVGKGVAIPADARRIDGRGKVVTAGFVDASTRLGLVEVDLEPSTQEGRFAANPHDDDIHAAYRVIDGYNPRSVGIPVARAGGVTSAVVTPTGALVAGTGAWMRLTDDSTARAVVRAPLAMYAALGLSATPSAAGSRGVAVEKLREVLDDARVYARSRGNFERNQSRPFAAGRLDLEALQPVLRGDLPLVVRAHRASDILAAAGIARELRVRVIIEGGTEAWTVAKELAQAQIPVILDPMANLPGSFDHIHVRDDAAAVLTAAGVDVVISTLEEATNVRTLRQRAGVAIANGLPYERALAAVTTLPARIFGLRDRGELRRGQAADVVVWSGDPFELSSRAEHVIIAGREQSLDNRQKLLLERYRHLGK